MWVGCVMGTACGLGCGLWLGLDPGLRAPQATTISKGCLSLAADSPQRCPMTSGGCTPGHAADSTPSCSGAQLHGPDTCSHERWHGPSPLLRRFLTAANASTEAGHDLAAVCTGTDPRRWACRTRESPWRPQDGTRKAGPDCDTLESADMPLTHAPHASVFRRSSARFCGRSVAVTLAPRRVSTAPAAQRRVCFINPMRAVQQAMAACSGYSV